MKNNIRPIAIMWAFTLSVLFSGCGSAEAIKGYYYPTTKDKLEEAVRKVIRSNPHIYHDSTKENKLDSIMEKAEREHSVADSALYYNDGKHYVTIKIEVGQIETDYIFRYYGDEAYWKNSSSSGIFISSVHNRHGKGLSQGHNENGEFTSKMAKESTTLFETEFIKKVDNELHLKHSED